jgi:hypothetical protein
VQRPLLIFAALAAAVALFAVRMMPATLADARIAAMTRGGVHLIDVEGTLWNARGILAAGATRIPIAWRIDLLPLLRRELHLHLVRGGEGPVTSPRGDIAIGTSSVELRDIEGTIPAGFFGAAAGSGPALLVGGDVEINAALIEWAPPANRGEARIRWRAAWLTAPGSVEAIELGDITAALSAEADRLSGPVSNTGGDLAVRGTVALSASSGLQLSLVLTPRRAEDRELAHALSMLGAPEGDGWRVEWRLPLR